MKNGFPYFRAQGFTVVSNRFLRKHQFKTLKIFNLISSKIKKLLYRYTETAAFIFKSAESQIFIYLITRNGICLDISLTILFVLPRIVFLSERKSLRNNSSLYRPQLLKALRQTTQIIQRI